MDPQNFPAENSNPWGRQNNGETFNDAATYLTGETDSYLNNMRFNA